MNYIELLEKEFIKIKHPITGKTVKLYRTMSSKAFQISVPVGGESNKESSTILEETLDIPRYHLGGYVQSLDNIDASSPVWIDNEAKVFDSAIIKNGSYIADKAMVFGNAVIDNSSVTNFAKVHMEAYIENSWIANMTTVKDTAVVKSSKVLNYSMVYNMASITDVLVMGGSYINGTAEVTKSILRDYSMIGGSSKVTNVTLSERASIVNDSVADKELSVDPKLGIERSE